MDKTAIVSECKRRNDEMRNARSLFEPLWQDAARRCLPMSADIAGYDDPARRADMSDSFDSTAMLALGKFAAALCSVATPPASKWHNIVPANPDLAEDTEVMRWCELVRDRLFTLRGHHLANFTSAVIDVYRQLGVFGHGAMFVHHDVGRAVRYMAIPVREIWIDTDPAGMLDTVHRQYSLTVRQALKEFADDDLPAEVASLADKPDQQDKKLTFLHCVYPNPDFDPKRADARGKPYLSVHLHKHKVVRLGGYRAMPYLAPRYETMSGSPYGFGPALLSLPDIKMLNEMSKTGIRAAHLAVEPPLLLANDDLLSPFGIQPAYLNYGGIDDQGRPTVKPLDLGQRFDVGIEFMQFRQAPVNDSFLVTLFQILVEQPQMTATEVLQRAQEKGVLLAPVMARIQAELLGPLTSRELDILFDIPGALPPPPEQLAGAGGLEVEYASPLAKTMQSGGEALGFQRLLEAALPLAQVDPGILDLFNFDEGMRVLSQAVGAPAKAMRSPEEVAAIREQKAQARQAQQLLTAAPVLSESMKNMAQAQAVAGAEGI